MTKSDKAADKSADKASDKGKAGAGAKEAHRTKQKTAGEIRAAESFDEKLYADPPSPEECPICCLPIGEDDLTYTPCCGKNICSGCMGSMLLTPGPDRCPFCNTPVAQNIKEAIKRIYMKGSKSTTTHARCIG